MNFRSDLDGGFGDSMVYDVVVWHASQRTCLDSKSVMVMICYTLSDCDVGV